MIGWAVFTVVLGLVAVDAVALESGVAAAASPQPVIGGPPGENGLPLSREQIEQRIAAINQDTALTPEQRGPVIEAYRAALNDLTASEELSAQLQKFVGDAEHAAATAETMRQKLKSLAAEPTVADTRLPLVELEQQLTQAELQLANLKQSRQNGQAELQTRSQRRKEIRAQLVALQQRLGETESKPVAEAGEVTPLSAAQSLQATASLWVLKREAQVLEAELAKYDAEEAVGLVQLRSDQLAKQIGLAEKTIEALQTRIKVARDQAAAESVRKAKMEAIDADTELKAYAQENQALAERAKRVADALATTEADLNTAKEAYERLSGQFKQTRRKVETVGLTSSIGAMLRKERTHLPEVRQRKVAVANRQSLINDVQYELFEYDDDRQAITDGESMISEMVGQAQGRDEDLLRSAASELLTRKKEYLDALIRTSNQYFDTLIELDVLERQVIALTAEYQNYIDERVLWIRSARLLTSDFAVESSDTDLIRAERWASLGVMLAQDALRRFPLYLLVAAIGIALVIRRRRMRERIRDAGAAAAKGNCRTIIPTLWTCCLTVVVSSGMPLLCAFLAWRLTRLPFESEFAKAVSQGLFGVGIIWAASELLRQICRPCGLAESHFGWTKSVTATTRGEIRRVQVLALPVVFVVGALSASDSSHGRNAVERVAYVTGMGLLAFFLGRLFRPDGLLRDALASRQTGWFDRLKYVWMLIAVSVPVLLATLAFMGYYYTAKVLFWRVFATVIFITAVIMMRALLFRMLLLRRRSLSIEQARQRAAALAQGENEGGGPVAGIVTSSPETDITTQSLQSRKLVNTALVAATVIGLWFIWVQVLPALGMLDKYRVWGGSPTQIAATTESSVAASPVLPGGVAAESGDEATTEVPSGTVSPVVTLSDLALAILIAFVTFVIARNGPGLLEISVLQQLPVDASVRYAITTLVSYAIILVGVITTCSTIGLQWSQIQWLATALTFGLAFGLQEMFANFVAGLIILLERPIRVGDVVTVDDVTGVVSRIRIRATSITNWDRKEYVVPNKEFITGRLLNWTLSDKVNRITINVGLAYGSDTERARELLLQCANDHPLILDDPPSVATFEGFGDNSLNLVLRTYLPTLDNRLEVIHQLHTAIDQAFRRAGLEIAFPQRDLHVRSLPAEFGRALLGDVEPASQQHRGAA